MAPAPAPAAVAQVKPKGSMTMVIEAEPATILIKDATTENGYFVLGNVFDKLTARDWSSGEPKIVGGLAESFSQLPTDPKTWRFKLRQGLKFTNGEPITADAVVAVVDSVVDPAKPGHGIDEFGLTWGQGDQDRRVHRRHHDRGGRRHPPESAGADGDPGPEVARLDAQ